MKYLPFLFFILIACTQHQAPKQKATVQVVPKADTIHVYEPAHYFMVSYITKQNQKGAWSFGTYFTIGHLVSQDSFRYYIWHSNECDYHWGYKQSDYAIMGLTEFKDSAEYAVFKNAPFEPLSDCPPHK